MDKELDRLVELLVDHAMVVVSGTKAAAEIGVPHSTLQDWIDRLRAHGADIAGVRGRGFVLRALPDILTRRVIKQAAHGTQFGAQVHHYYSVGSTMDVASELAHRGAPHGTIVLAEEQTAGRGRLGHSWYSERSTGIYCSLILRPTMPAALAPVFTLAAGLAVADTVSELTHQPADLRWPNDVLLGELKCGGVLLEMTAEAERVKHLGLGIGVNVNQQAFPRELAEVATSLALVAGRRFSRAEVLETLLRALDGRCCQFLDVGSASVIADFQSRSSFAWGRRVAVENESSSFTGVTQGVDSAGFLLVRHDDTGNVEPVLAGTLRPA